LEYTIHEEFIVLREENHKKGKLFPSAPLSSSTIHITFLKNRAGFFPVSVVTKGGGASTRLFLVTPGDKIIIAASLSYTKFSNKNRRRK
jgi:hypothetical protein